MAPLGLNTRRQCVVLCALLFLSALSAPARAEVQENEVAPGVMLSNRKLSLGPCMSGSSQRLFDTTRSPKRPLSNYLRGSILFSPDQTHIAWVDYVVDSMGKNNPPGLTDRLVAFNLHTRASQTLVVAHNQSITNPVWKDNRTLEFALYYPEVKQLRGVLPPPVLDLVHLGETKYSKKAEDGIHHILRQLQQEAYPNLPPPAFGADKAEETEELPKDPGVKSESLRERFLDRFFSSAQVP